MRRTLFFLLIISSASFAQIGSFPGGGSGGGSTPLAIPGSNGSALYNNNGALGADSPSNFGYDGQGDLTVGKSLTVGGGGADFFGAGTYSEVNTGTLGVLFPLHFLVGGAFGEAQPICAVGVRGLLWVILGNGTTTNDTYYRCSNDAGTYNWDPLINSGSSFSSPMTTLGQIIYQGSSGPQALNGNTSSTKEFYCSQGTGSVANAPALCVLAANDVPTLIDFARLRGEIANERLGHRQTDHGHVRPRCSILPLSGE
jgi:hypothetical protein